MASTDELRSFFQDAELRKVFGEIAERIIGSGNRDWWLKANRKPPGSTTARNILNGVWHPTYHFNAIHQFAAKLDRDLGELLNEAREELAHRRSVSRATPHGLNSLSYITEGGALRERLQERNQAWQSPADFAETKKPVDERFMMEWQLNYLEHNTEPLVFSGDGGVGKTRMAVELCNAASSRSMWPLVAYKRTTLDNVLEASNLAREESRKLIILVDYIEEMNAEFEFDDLCGLAKREGFAIVATTRNSEVTKATAPRCLSEASQRLDFSTEMGEHGHWLQAWRQNVCRNILESSGLSKHEKSEIIRAANPAIATLFAFSADPTNESDPVYNPSNSRWMIHRLLRGMNPLPDEETLVFVLACFRMDTVSYAAMQSELTLKKTLDGLLKGGWIGKRQDEGEENSQLGVWSLGHDIVSDIPLTRFLLEQRDGAPGWLENHLSLATKYGAKAGFSRSVERVLPRWSSISGHRYDSREFAAFLPFVAAASEDQELAEKVFELLPGSISLTDAEKVQLASAMLRLSSQHLNDLIGIFIEEREKFAELEREFADDIAKLKAQSFEENGQSNIEGVRLRDIAEKADAILADTSVDALRREVAEMQIVSLSLQPHEKVRVLAALPSLPDEKVKELRQVFRKERATFVGVAKRRPEIIAQLLIECTEDDPVFLSRFINANFADESELQTSFQKFAESFALQWQAESIQKRLKELDGIGALQTLALGYVAIKELRVNQDTDAVSRFLQAFKAHPNSTPHHVIAFVLNSLLGHAVFQPENMSGHAYCLDWFANSDDLRCRVQAAMAAFTIGNAMADGGDLSALQTCLDEFESDQSEECRSFAARASFALGTARADDGDFSNLQDCLDKFAEDEDEICRSQAAWAAYVIGRAKAEADDLSSLGECLDHFGDDESGICRHPAAGAAYYIGDKLAERYGDPSGIERCYERFSGDSNENVRSIAQRALRSLAAWRVVQRSSDAADTIARAISETEKQEHMCVMFFLMFLNEPNSRTRNELLQHLSTCRSIEGDWSFDDFSDLVEALPHSDRKDALILIEYFENRLEKDDLLIQLQPNKSG